MTTLAVVSATLVNIHLKAFATIALPAPTLLPTNPLLATLATAASTALSTAAVDALPVVMASPLFQLAQLLANLAVLVTFRAYLHKIFANSVIRARTALGPSAVALLALLERLMVLWVQAFAHNATLAISLHQRVKLCAQFVLRGPIRPLVLLFAVIATLAVTVRNRGQRRARHVTLARTRLFNKQLRPVFARHVLLERTHPPSAPAL